MQAPLRQARAPSRSLLRFLRVQSEVAFFNHSNIATHAVKAPGCHASAANIGRPRSLTTACEQKHAATLEASLLDLQPLLRRLTRREARHTTRASRFSTTGATARSADAEDDTSIKKTKQDASAPSWQEKLWGVSAKKGGKPLKPDDLPGREDFDHGAMFNIPRSLSAKMSLDPRLRCTEVDEHGKVILVDGEFKKTELIAKVRCHTACGITHQS